MRLLVHVGFHKTTSTFLQHRLNNHHQILLQRGILYDPQADYPAHREAGWAAMAGDPAPLAAMLARGQAHGVHTVIFSAEDLEAALFDPRIAATIEHAARDAGAAIEWHVTLREPAGYFSSLYAQLQHHCYADALTLFDEAMRTGGVYLPDLGFDHAGPPCWYYCFDHLRHLDRFTAGGRQLIVHDYADDRPFPGWRMLDALDVLDAVLAQPTESDRNRRLGGVAVQQGYRERIAQAGGSCLGGKLDAAIAASVAVAPECARLVGERFGDSHRAALARWSVR